MTFTPSTKGTYFDKSERDDGLSGRVQDREIVEDEN